MTKFLDACYEAITKQKTAIRDTINSVDTSAASAISGIERVILTGCGDSLAVANYGKWVLLKKGINALTVSPPEIEQIGLDDKSILIAISASGRSLTTIDSLRTAGDMGVSTILLTDNLEGSATEYAENVWLTKSHVASYDISPSSPTTSAMAYLLTVASDINRDYDELDQDLKILKSKGGQILEWGEEEGKKIAPIINPSGRLYLISDGVNYAAAEIGMCKVNEYSLTFANAILTEEFRHHYNLAVEEGDSAVLVSNSNAEIISYRKALKEILGMRVYHLRPDDELNLSTPLSQVIPNSIALQMAAYYAVVEYQPNKEGWKKPNVSSFEIY